MKCEKCGRELNENGICTYCNDENKVKNLDKKDFLITMGQVLFYGIIVVILLFLIFKQFKLNSDVSPDKDRIEQLENLEKKNKINFVVNEKEYCIGDEVKNFLDDGFIIDENSVDNYVPADSILVKTFYYEGIPYFLGAIYCPSSNKCTYEETSLIKINFYEASKVEIEDEIDFSLYENNITKLLGEKDGNFYQNHSLYVWSNGGDIGDSYYIAGFDSGGLFSTNKVNDLRIGIWWYEGEAEHTIDKESNDEEE